MAFEVEITKLERDEAAGKDVLRVEGTKTKDGATWKSTVFINKYNAEVVDALEAAGVGANVVITMEKRSVNGKDYWNVTKVETDVDEKPKAPPKKEPTTPKATPDLPGKASTNPEKLFRKCALDQAIEILHIASTGGMLAKKLTPELLAQEAMKVSNILEGYLEGKTTGAVTSDAKALSGKPTETPQEPDLSDGAEGDPF